MTKLNLMEVILSPYLSEKTAMVGDKSNQIVLKVALSASKLMVKKAIEEIFDVKVTKVRICLVKGKLKRYRRTLGRRKNWKKAYVSLAKGDDINFMDIV